jgi:hypothetical protein
VIVLVLMFAAGCARPVYPPQKHAEYRRQVKYDSVVVRDSVVVLREGDTIYVYRDRWRLRHDTVRLHDSIPYPVEVVHRVRHVPTVYRWSLWVAIAAVALMIKRVAFR